MEWIRPFVYRKYLNFAAIDEVRDIKSASEVLELGPPNTSIHKIDEHVPVAELETLKNIYRRQLINLSTFYLPNRRP